MYWLDVVMGLSVVHELKIADRLNIKESAFKDCHCVSLLFKIQNSA